MKKIFVICMILGAFFSSFAQDDVATAYYVNTMGNDKNDGLAELSAFKTLQYAVEMASRNKIKRIIVVGRLSERNASVLHVENTGADEIIITGKPNANASEKAVLTYTGSGWSGGVSISGKSNICFENIEFSGNQAASGIEVSVGALVTLGNGVKIKNNHSATGGGIRIYQNGILIIKDGAEISGNTCTEYTYGNGRSAQGKGGGIEVGDGVVIMYGGIISGNKVDGEGGGICLSGGQFIFHGGTITGNEAAEGGGVFIEYGHIWPQNGKIVGNKSEYGDTNIRQREN
jgi:hypothetical protein